MAAVAEFEFEASTHFDSDRQTVVTKVAKVLECLVKALPDSSGHSESQTIFACEKPPAVSFKQFLKRYTYYGQVPEELLVPALMLVDRALRTSKFTLKSVVHK